LNAAEIGAKALVLGRNELEGGAAGDMCVIRLGDDSCGVHEVGHDAVDHDVPHGKSMVITMEWGVGDVDGVVARKGVGGVGVGS